MVPSVQAMVALSYQQVHQYQQVLPYAMHLLKAENAWTAVLAMTNP